MTFLTFSCSSSQIFYLIIGVGLYLVFQDDTQSDVLLNFSVKSLGPLVGDAIAEAITYTVWLGYVLIRHCLPEYSLEHLGSFALQMTSLSKSVLLMVVCAGRYAFNLIVTYPMIQWGLREVRASYFKFRKVYNMKWKPCQSCAELYISCLS